MKEQRFLRCAIGNGCFPPVQVHRRILGVKRALLPHTSGRARLSDAHVFGSAPLFDCRAQEEEEEKKRKKKNGTTEQKHIPEIRHL